MVNKFNAKFALIAASAVFAISLVISALIVSQTNFTIRNLGGSIEGSGPANSISVNAEGSVSVRPDTATITIGVSEQADTSQAALDIANQKINQIRDIARGRVSAENIQTTGLNINPRYEYNDRERQRVLVGQQASQTIQVTIPDIAADASDVAVLIDEFSKINQIDFNGVRFSVENDGGPLSEARNLAMQNARAKAEDLASSAGVDVYTVISISENTRTYSPPSYFGRLESADAVASSNTEVSPGEQDVQVQVSVVYAIE